MGNKKVSAGIITGYGINADDELVEAFRRVGSEAEKIRVTDCIAEPESLLSYKILGFAGGFSFGDHLGSGLVFAQLFRKYCGEVFKRFLGNGGLVIGICNGFQVLVKMGFLPDTGGKLEKEVSLIHNDSGVFEDSWVTLSVNKQSPCVWTRNLDELDLPIRHGEGKFVTRADTVMESLEKNNLIALRYKGRNPNGSEGSIAGITEKTGRVLGLMPHPEAFLYPEQHPLFKRVFKEKDMKMSKALFSQGLALIENGVKAASEG